MYNLCARLYPINRSITGDGFRKSLAIIKEYLPELKVFEVPTGTKCFDWEVPKEWNIRDAYLTDVSEKRYCEFQKNNLHVVGYSVPVNKTVSYETLQEHLYSLPDAIPYVTSYYKEHWGFCYDEREPLPEGDYKVFIDSELKDGSLTYGELIIPGKSDKEILLSTYLCHPSMANDNLSGVAVATFLAKWLMTKERKYTVRLIIIPETIGSIIYLSRHLDELKKNVIAGFNLTCMGTEERYSYIPSRQGDDRAAKHVLDRFDYEYHSFLERGSDERQYCSPGVDLPVCSVMRSKFHIYPEYHTSKDDMDFISPEGLQGSYEVMQDIIRCIEANETLETTLLCEPQLGKRGLYPTVSTSQSRFAVKDMMNLIAYSDGSRDLLEVAELIGVYLLDILPLMQRLKDEGILKVV